MGVFLPTPRIEQHNAVVVPDPAVIAQAQESGERGTAFRRSEDTLCLPHQRDPIEHTLVGYGDRRAVALTKGAED